MNHNHLPILDRRPYFDERSRNFAAVAPNDTREFVSKTWSCDVYNDQGREGACVGFGWTHELAAEPDVIRRDAEFAIKIYDRAKELDDFPGEGYSGTSVLAGVKAVQELLNSEGKHYIEEYRWAFGTQDALRVVGYDGPVVLGIEWHNNMYYPNEQGWIALGGGVVGGHCILMNGVEIVKLDDTKAAVGENLDLHKSFVRLHNSWGTNYGDGGDAYLSVYDLDYLLGQQGEACVPVIRSGE